MDSYKDYNPYHANGAIMPRKKDNQQWLLDYLIRTTGRTHCFEIDGRFIPEGVATHDQIPTACYRKAIKMEQVARAAHKEGDYITARDIYHSCAYLYHLAQHAIFTDKNPDKLVIHKQLQSCYEQVCEINDYPLERVEIPWEGKYIQGLFHMIPGRPVAPVVLYLPGMDMCKETAIDPANNPFIKRGFHVLVIDGPGQGTSNIRGIKVTHDSYERAASACVDWLIQRPEVDPEKIVSLGFSMGTFWNMRLFASDKRIKASSGLAACYCTKDNPLSIMMETWSLRTKQVFMYMCGIEDEVEFDKFVSVWHHEDHAPLIDRPFLFATGEFDPLTPLASAEKLFSMMTGPKELWVIQDGIHSGVRENISNFGGIPATCFLIDWLKKALDGKFEEGHSVKRYIPKTPGLACYGHEVPSFDLATRVPREF